MKKMLITGSLALILPFAVAWAASMGHESMGHAVGGNQGKSITVKGEILDMACYMGHEAKGTKHKKCAEACIREGAPMGLLTKEGKVYLLVEDHANKKPYESLKEKAAEIVSVTGDYRSHGGVQSLVVKKFAE